MSEKMKFDSGHLIASILINYMKLLTETDKIVLNFF